MTRRRRKKCPAKSDPISDLITAAKSGDPEVIRHKASALGKDLNLVYPSGRTLLTKAIEDNEALSTVEAIIKAGANVDVQNRQGKTALMVAITVKRSDVLKVLLESGANQDLVTQKNMSAVSICLKEGMFSYLEILLKNVSYPFSFCERLKEIASFIRQRDKNSKASGSHYGATDLTVEPDLISCIKNSCSVNCTDLTGTTPLMYAVKCHYDDCVRLLLLAGADVNRMNKNKETALTLAMARGANPILKDLIMAGAFMKHPKGKTSTMQFEMFKKILDYLQGNGLFNMHDIYGKTALIYAAERGDRRCIMYAVEIDVEEFESLLERKRKTAGNGNVCGKPGIVSARGTVKTVEDHWCENCDRYVLGKGYNYKDKNGTPILMYAIKTKTVLSVSYIRARMCDELGYRDCQGRTILMNYFKSHDNISTLILRKTAHHHIIGRLSSLHHEIYLSYKTILELFGENVKCQDDNGTTTIIYAIKYYPFLTEEMVSLLVGDTQKAQYEGGRTALMIALQSYKGSPDTYIQPLIGDSCNIQDTDGKTALMYAMTHTCDIPDNLILQMIGDSQNVQDKVGKTALMYAMMKTRGIPDNIIAEMIGDSQNTQDNDGKTALMYAFIHNKQLSEKMIECLNGGNPLIQDKSGKTALMYALQLNRRLTFNTIKSLFGGMVHICDTEGDTTVVYAIKYYTFLTEEIVAILVGDTQRNQYKDGKTALMIALPGYNAYLENNRQYFRIPFEKKYWQWCMFPFSYFGRTYEELLRYQKLSGDYLRPLIVDSCNIQDKEGKTALMYALTSKTCVLTTLVMKMIGNSQNLQDKEGKTALMYALTSTTGISTTLVMKMIGNSHNLQDKEGKTALMYALQNCNDKTYTFMKELIGGSFNIQDKDGKTALMYALQYYNDQSYTFIEKLIGGSFNIQDKEGKTALMYAVRYAKNITDRFLNQLLGLSQNKHDKGVRISLVLGSERAELSRKCLMRPNNGALINVQDNVGKTALHYAIEHRQATDYMKLIVLNGANLEIQDNKGQTALMLCVEFDTRVINHNGYVNGLNKHFIKTKTLLRYNAIPILNSRGKKKIFSIIKKGLFNSMNLFKNNDIFRLIIANGIVPFPDCRFKLSTLSVVLKHNLTDVTKYVIANMCLTNDDLKMMKSFKNLKTLNSNSRNHPYVSNLNNVDLSSPDLQHLLSDATSQPWPLVKLAFIAVNSAVGHGVHRERRIKRLPLPNPIKDMLMFHTRTALLPVSEWADIPMVFDTVEYEKTSRPRPLLNYWPFGDVLVV